MTRGIKKYRGSSSRFIEYTKIFQPLTPPVVSPAVDEKSTVVPALKSRYDIRSNRSKRFLLNHALDEGRMNLNDSNFIELYQHQDFNIQVLFMILSES